jgi:hypothetical protein
MAYDPLTALLDFGGKVLDKFVADPQAKAAAQIKLAEMAQSGELAKMANETETTKAFLADTQSARVRDTAFLQAGKKNWRGDMLAYAAMGSLVGVILLLFVFKVPQESREILLVVLGALVTIVKDVYGFEFGSSKDSQRNAQAVTDMLKNGG